MVGAEGGREVGQGGGEGRKGMGAVGIGPCKFGEGI